MELTKDIRDSLHDILDNNICASLATITQENTCHSNTIYFCYDKHTNIYFASDSNTEHARNIVLNSNVSLAIWNTPVDYAVDHKGLQMEGVCKAVNGIDQIKAWSIYINRFPIFKNKIGSVENIINKIVSMRLYKIDITRIIITDVSRFHTDVKTITK